MSITLRGAAAVAASVLPMLAFDLAGLAGFWDIANYLATWEAILVASVALTLAYLVARRLRGPSPGSSPDGPSP